MRAAARAKAQRAVPLEYNLLLTATLCLLAVRSGDGLQRVVGARAPAGPGRRHRRSWSAT